LLLDISIEHDFVAPPLKITLGFSASAQHFQFVNLPSISMDYVFLILLLDILIEQFANLEDTR